MPTSAVISAAFGAALAQSGVIALATWKAALLYGALGAAQFALNRPRGSTPSQAARTQQTVREDTEPERIIYGIQRVGGLLVHYEENPFRVEGVRRADGRTGKDGRTWTDPYQNAAWVLYLASHPCDGLGDELGRPFLWIEGVRQLARAGSTWTSPPPTPGPREGSVRDYLRVIPSSERTIHSPLVPQRGGPWGIGNGTSSGDEPIPNHYYPRLTGMRRNMEWERWPWIVWPRLTGQGKPPYAQPRAGTAWWDGRQRDEDVGGAGHSYVMVDAYQNSSKDDSRDRGDDYVQPFSWRGFPIDFQFLVRGKRIRFPVNSAGEEGEAVWSDNPAVVGWDILRNVIGYPVQALDAGMFIEAAAACRELIPGNPRQVDAPPGYRFDARRQIRRYGADGVLVSGDSGLETMRQVVLAMNGALITSGGRIGVRAGVSTPGGGADLHEVREDDVIDMPRAQVQPATNDRINRLGMSLRQSALHEWTGLPMGEVVNRPAEFTDRGTYPSDLGEASFITHPTRANLLMQSELAKIRVARGGASQRLANTYTFTIKTGADDEHMEIRVLDRVLVHWPPLFGDTPVEIEVLSMEVSPDWTITLVGRGNGAEVGGIVPYHCPGFGDPPPVVPAADLATGHGATLYVAPTTLLGEVVDSTTAPPSGAPDAPPAPAVSQITQASFQVEVPPAAGVTGWRARIRTAAAWSRWRQSAVSRVFSYTGLSAGTSYEVQCAHGNAHGWSAPSPVADITTPAPDAPAAPTRLTIGLDSSSGEHNQYYSASVSGRSSYAVDRVRVTWTGMRSTGAIRATTVESAVDPASAVFREEGELRTAGDGRYTDLTAVVRVKRASDQVWSAPATVRRSN